jgi:hypothetical protein
MKDVAGRELEIGDVVAATYVGCPDLKIGVVDRFSPKKIIVKFKDNSHKRESELAYHTEHKFPSQVCLLSKKIL